jgi:hypothetical protein
MERGASAPNRRESKMEALKVVQFAMVVTLAVAIMYVGIAIDKIVGM